MMGKSVVLVLRPDLTLTEHNRSVFDKDGKFVKRLQFAKGIPVELNEPADIAAVRDSIGPVMVLCEVEKAKKKGDRDTINLEPRKTAEAVLSIAKSKKEAGLTLLRHQREALQREIDNDPELQKKIADEQKVAAEKKAKELLAKRQSAEKAAEKEKAAK